MKDISGSFLAKADSMWTYISTDKGTPERIPKDILNGYRMEQRLDMDYLGRKISFPKDENEGEECRRINVTEHLLDANHHVNNGKYVELAAGLVPEASTAGRVRVEYRRQAFLGETIYPRIYRTDESTVVKLSDEGGDPYTIVEFSKGPAQV